MRDLTLAIGTDLRLARPIATAKPRGVLRSVARLRADDRRLFAGVEKRVTIWRLGRASTPPAPFLDSCHIGSPRQGVKQTRLKGAERRTRFLDAAAEIVVEDGVSAVTMDGVAARCGVAKSLGYRYFKDRDDLLGALFDREMQAYVDHARENMKPDARLEDWIRGGCRQWFRLADEQGQLFTRLAGDNGPLASRARAAQRATAQGWAAGLQAAYRLPQRQAEHMAWFIVSGAAGILSARNGEDDEALIETLVVSVVAACEALRAKYAPPRTKNIA